MNGGRKFLLNISYYSKRSAGVDRIIYGSVPGMRPNNDPDQARARLHKRWLKKWLYFTNVLRNRYRNFLSNKIVGSQLFSCGNLK